MEQVLCSAEPLQALVLVISTEREKMRNISERCYESNFINLVNKCVTREKGHSLFRYIII